MFIQTSSNDNGLTLDSNGSARLGSGSQSIHTHTQFVQKKTRRICDMFTSVSMRKINVCVFDYKMLCIK